MAKISKVEKNDKSLENATLNKPLLSTYYLPYTLLGAGNVTINNVWPLAWNFPSDVRNSHMHATVTQGDRWCASSWRKCKPNQIRRGPLCEGDWRASERNAIWTGCWATSVCQLILGTQLQQWTVSPLSWSCHSCRQDKQNPNGPGNRWCKGKFWQVPWRKQAAE